MINTDIEEHILEQIVLEQGALEILGYIVPMPGTCANSSPATTGRKNYDKLRREVKYAASNAGAYSRRGCERLRVLH
jgi:hypothetical protein